MIVSRFAVSTHTVVRCVQHGMLPLHLAVLIPNVPYAIINALVRVHPTGNSLCLPECDRIRRWSRPDHALCVRAGVCAGVWRCVCVACVRERERVCLCVYVFLRGAALTEPFREPVHTGIQGYLPLTFMFVHQAVLRWGSFPDAVRRRDGCVSADHRPTAAWISEAEVDSVMSFRDVVFSRANGGEAVHGALSDARGMPVCSMFKLSPTGSLLLSCCVYSSGVCHTWHFQWQCFVAMLCALEF